LPALWHLRRLFQTAPGIHRLAAPLSFGLLLCVACKRDPPRYKADTLYQRAEASFQHGDLKDALSDVDDALRVVGNRDPNAFWRLRLLKSEILIWQGLSQDALTLLKPGELPEPSNAVLAARRSVLLGIAESNLQQLDLADRTFRATEGMQGADSPEVMGDLLLGEGKLAAFHGDPAKSELLFKHALQIAQENGQTFLASKALGNLGILQMQQYHYADAVDLFNATLAAARKLDAQASIVKTTVNLGWAYLRMGDFDRASELFEESEKRSEQLGMMTDQETALINMAGIQFVQHNFSTAERDYKQALHLARRLNNQQEIVFGLIDLAQIAIEKSDFELAEKYNNEALALERSIGDHDSELYSLVNEAQISFWRQDSRTAERLLRKVVHDSRNDVKLQVMALWTLARIDAQLSRIEAAKMHYEAAFVSLEEERKSLGRDELKLSYPTNAKDIYSDYIDFLVQHGMADEAFRVAELQRARTLTDGLGLNELQSQAFNVREAEHAAAGLGHVILSYWIGTKQSYLWIFLPDHSQLFVLPGEDRVRPLLERYHAHLVGASFDANDLGNADGQELYRILLGPAEQWIKPQSQVTIISDGELCGLNFETLLVSSPKPHYWIEDVSVTNASSVFLLTLGTHSAIRHSTESGKTLLLIGNPQSPANYPALSHAGEEIHLVGGHFSPDQETVLSGKSATPAAYFKAKPENYALIHFVAHGTASRISPLDSAVVLSEDGTSYNLYARDIARNKLNARLVTISACDSAGNRIYSSEGLVGLSWAFLRAGAQRVIASLWEVNDASTPQFMDHLYSAMAQGEDPESALRAAKLALLRSETVNRRPFYWASFVLYEGI
jgi:CHAT domain-containing protein/tetratricopeptide (TPR) repeat protein